MEIYFLVMGLIVALGFGVELSKQNHWEGRLLLPKREIRVSVSFLFWCVIFAVFLLFGGLRYRVGTDFESYCTIFENICKDWDHVLYGGTERGYVWLNRILSLYTTNPQWPIFVTNALICMFGLTCILKFSRFVPISLYLFYTTIYYQGFNLIRQGMACAVVLLAFGYARQRRLLASVLLILGASLFHRTALIVLPVLILMLFPYSQAMYFVYLAMASLAFFLREQINGFLLRFYPSAANTSDTYLYEEFSPVQIILCLIYVILCFLYYKKLLQRDKRNILYINMSVLLLGLYTCFYWIPMWGRLQLYFICFYALILPEVISCEESRVLRTLYYAVIWGIMLFFYMVPVLSSGSGFWEYQIIS